MSDLIFVLTKNNTNVGFVTTREQAISWLEECREQYNLDPDYNHTFEHPNDHTMTVYSSYKWFVMKYFKFEDTYTFSEVPLYV